MNIFKSAWMRTGIVFTIVTAPFLASYVADKIFTYDTNTSLELWLIVVVTICRNMCIFPSLLVFNFGNVKKNNIKSQDKLLSKPSSIDRKFLFWLYPLAKIGYTGFLSHFVVIYLVLGMHTDLDEGKGISLVSYFSQIIILSIIGGTILKLTIEQPLYNLYQLMYQKCMKASNKKTD